MLVYLLKKREHATWHHTINRSHQSCVDVTPRVRTITPSGSRTQVSGAGGGRSNKERQRLQPVALVARAPLFEVRRVRFTHRLYWHTHLLHWHPTVGINAPPEWRNFFFCFFLWFSLSSLRFLPPGVGLTGPSRPSKVLLEFKALILKTEHKQMLQNWSREHIAFRLKTGSALIAVWKRTASCSTF